MQANNWSVAGGTVATFEPGTQPSAACISIAARKQGGWIAAATGANTYFYKFNPYQGFTSLHETHASEVGTIKSVEFSRCGTAVFIAGSSGCKAYAFDASTGRGTAYPTTVFTVSNFTAVHACLDADIIFIGGTGGSRAQAFAWLPGIGWGGNIGSGNGLAVLNTSDVWYSDLCENGTRYAVRSQTASGFDVATATTTAIGDWSANSITAQNNAVAILANVNLLVTASNNSNDLQVWTLTDDSNAVSQTTLQDNNGNAYCLQYIPSQRGLLVGTTGTSPVVAFAVNESGDLTALTDPSTAGTTVNDLDIY